MKITILGTGTSQGIPVIGCQCATCQSDDPRDKRLRCSLLVSQDSTKIVIDVGPDFRSQMLMAGVNHLDAVFLTHEHNDHIIGLDDLRPLIFKSRKPIVIYGEERVLSQIRTRFSYAFGTNLYPGAPKFDLKVIHPGDVIEVGDIKLEVLRIQHGGLPIVGFRIGNFAYCTDVSGISSTTLEKLGGLHTLVISALRKKRHHAHFNLNQAIEVIQLLDPDQAFLIHMSHVLGPTKVWEGELPEKIGPAYDGMVINI